MLSTKIFCYAQTMAAQAIIVLLKRAYDVAVRMKGGAMLKGRWLEQAHTNTVAMPSGNQSSGAEKQVHMPGLTFIWSAKIRFLCWRVYLTLLRVSAVSSHPTSGW